MALVTHSLHRLQSQSLFPQMDKTGGDVGGVVGCMVDFAVGLLVGAGTGGEVGGEVRVAVGLLVGAGTGGEVGGEVGGKTLVQPP